MYDYEWARRIVVQFRQVRTRTNNLDACIIERCQELDAEKHVYTSFFITKALIHALANKHLNKFWRAYQKLQKKSPLDLEQLSIVVGYIYSQAAIRSDEEKQLRLDF